MRNKKILFYTDCPIFGGCEKPLFEILASDKLSSEYNSTLIFRSSGAYLKGLEPFRSRLPEGRSYGIRLLDINSIVHSLHEKIKNPRLLKLAEKSVATVFILVTPFAFIYDLLRLSALFGRNKADVIHINNGGYPGALGCRAAAVAARFAGFKKVIFSVHNTAFNGGGFVERLKDYPVKRSVDVFVTGSKASGLALEKNRGFDPDKITTIYHGVRPAEAKSGPSGEGLGRYISMVARFEERKGYRYAVEAFKKMVKGNPLYSDIKLVLIGDGPELADIKQLVVSEGLGDKVRFMGHRKDYIDFVAKSLFLINPSVGYEDLPYVILEAMSLGVPVIGTDIAGIPEEIEDGVTGIVVPPKDAEALGRAILKMLSDKESRDRMGKAGQERFHKLFTLDKMVNNYLMLYEKGI